VQKFTDATANALAATPRKCIGTVEIDDLTVRRLHVIEEKPSASRESDAG
jgi:hypothetical protein